ncbi:hypothetical protein [Parerythrobacter aestuarii]|uniref:hypothetical protein n=1 Tax=Parerythrobacter aestuarii TaxID=3020909 RepID=UPI0024DE7FE7|nr:hypothetical protein [Parerythrobacter aestuarii]
MDKKLVFAVAGSGKTSLILNSIDDAKRSLIITYTNENLRSIEASLIEKYGHLPSHIHVRSYFSFLYSFCLRPYVSYKLRDNAYTWKLPTRSRAKTTDARYYVSPRRYIYGNRAAKLVSVAGLMDKVRRRLARYYDDLYVDEVQDFAAHDFNFLLELSATDIDVLLVGDFFQHTFDTSRDGNVRKNLHKKGPGAYLKEFEAAGFEIDTDSLDKTWRCSAAVCAFIQSNIGINISSAREEDTKVHLIKDAGEALRLFDDDEKVKLFYQESKKYPCHSNNWGKCKGLNRYGDVCVVLNRTTAKAFEDGKLADLPEATRNKLYVACSRARGDLYILLEDHVRSRKRN